MDFGQGVGGAIVLDGKLYAQPLPLSGELGHSPVEGNRRRCGCGNIGCLETLVSQRGLLESSKSGVHSPDSTVHVPQSKDEWERLVGHVRERGMEPWLQDTLNTTAKVIAGVLNVLGIARVIVTGCLNEFPDFVVKHLAEELKKCSLWGQFGEVTCQSATHRRAAGLVAFGLDRLVLPAEHESGATPRHGREIFTFQSKLQN